MKNLLLTAALSCAVLASCQSQEKPKNMPKNTANASDQMQQMKAVAGQTESEGDRRISQSVRQALVGNQTFSMEGKNIVIATKNGVVHLRGRVADEKEKQEIARLARAIVGVRQVENHLEVMKAQ